MVKSDLVRVGGKLVRRPEKGDKAGEERFKKSIEREQKRVRRENLKEVAQKIDKQFKDTQFQTVEQAKEELQKIKKQNPDVYKFMNVKPSTFEKQQNKRINKIQNRIERRKKDIEESKKDEDKYRDRDDERREIREEARQRGYREEIEELEKFLPRFKKGEIINPNKVIDFAQDVGRAKEREEEAEELQELQEKKQKQREKDFKDISKKLQKGKNISKSELKRLQDLGVKKEEIVRSGNISKVSYKGGTPSSVVVGGQKISLDDLSKKDRENIQLTSVKKAKVKNLNKKVQQGKTLSPEDFEQARKLGIKPNELLEAAGKQFEIEQELEELKKQKKAQESKIDKSFKKAGLTFVAEAFTPKQKKKILNRLTAPTRAKVASIRTNPNLKPLEKERRLREVLDIDLKEVIPKGIKIDFDKNIAKELSRVSEKVKTRELEQIYEADPQRFKEDVTKTAKELKEFGVQVPRKNASKKDYIDKLKQINNIVNTLNKGSTKEKLNLLANIQEKKNLNKKISRVFKQGDFQELRK